MSDMEQKYILFHIDLQSGIFCENDLLGKKFEIQIRDLKGFIEFPNVDPELTETDRNQLYPPLFFDLFKSTHRKYEWGFIRGYIKKIDKWEIHEVIAQRLILYFVCKDVNEGRNLLEQKKVRDLINKWISTLKEHLRIFGKTNLFYDKNKGHAHVEIFFPNGERSQLINFLNTIKVVLPPANLRDFFSPLSILVLKKILNYCSKDKKIPLCYYLLNRSRISLDAKNYNHSVLDCATAVECLITERLENFIDKKYNRDFRNSLLNKYSRLSDKYKLAKYLNIFNKDYDLEFLFEKRNKAIHEGEIVTREEAEKAFSIAEQMIYENVTHLFK